MTKKVDEDQAALLRELAEAREVLQDIRRQEDVAKERVWELVSRGFEMDVSGVKLSRESGLSQTRVYQIREEQEATADGKTPQAV